MKSIYQADYVLMCDLLREIRERAGLTQDELADLASGEVIFHKSYIGKIERGERRLDVLELRELCRAMGIPLSKFAALLEERIARDAA